MNSIVVTSTKQNIKFGYEGEDNVTKIIFPYDESWLEYGEGNFEVRILRCGDEVAYTATEVVDDRQAMTLTMTVTDIELSVRGRGEMQLCYVCPDSIKKSPIYQYTVNRSVDYKYAVDPPEGSIIASVEKSLSEIKNTTNRLSNSVISIESSIDDVNSQIDNINDKISEFDEEIDSIGEVETRVDNLETSIQSINGRINTAEGNINENTESISDLNESVTELENRKVTDLETSGGRSDSGKYLTVGTDGKIKATSLTIPPTITVDASLSTTSTNPVQNKVIKTELNNINSNIATCNTEISKINGSLDTLAIYKVSRNLLDFTDMEEGYYINQTNGVKTALEGQGSTKYLPVEAGNLCFSCNVNTTNLGTIRYAFYNTNKAYISGGTLGLTAIDTTTARYYRTVTAPENVAFMRISAGIEMVWNAGSFQLEEGTTPTEYLPYGFDESIIKENALPEVVTNVVIPKKYKSNYASGNISDGEYLMINEKASVKKAETLVFSCDITEFNSVNVGYTNSIPTQKLPYAEITTTQVIIHANNLNGQYNATFSHGLTIDVNMQFRLTINAKTIDFELISNGSRYTNTVDLFKANSLVMPFVSSVGSTLTNCKLSWCPSDINKKIWMFGDSYFGLTNTKRWVYWLVESGFADNALIDAYAGRSTAHAITSLATLIKFGKPDYIVWAMGMNDGNDDLSAPSQNWVSGVNYLLSLCETYNIIPVFCTIPNVPTINHTKKNAWIKESGHRYIDFAEAVGATIQGSEWYTGMLASDGVHPTEKGALALYGKAISDFPEVTIAV